MLYFLFQNVYNTKKKKKKTWFKYSEFFWGEVSPDLGYSSEHDIDPFEFG